MVVKSSDTVGVVEALDVIRSRRADWGVVSTPEGNSICSSSKMFCAELFQLTCTHGS